MVSIVRRHRLMALANAVLGMFQGEP